MAKSLSPRTRTTTIDSAAPAPSSVKIEIESAAAPAPSYYVNNTSIETSVWDVKLRLSETLATDKDRNILHVRELAVVRMSLQHAKVVAGILVEHIASYEKKFGKIPGVATEATTRTTDDQ